MGLGNYLKKKLEHKEDSPMKTKQKADALKWKQELYEEERRGRHAAQKRQAYERGRKSVNNRGGIIGTLGRIDSSISAVEKTFGMTGNQGWGNTGSIFDVGGAPAPRPRTKTTTIKNQWKNHNYQGY